MAQSGYKNGLKKTPKGFWAFKIRVGRKTKMGTFATTRLETARKLLDQVRDDLLRQQEGLEVNLTVAEAMNYWLESRFSNSKHLTRAIYAFDKVHPVLGDVRVRHLTQATIVAFKQTLLDPKESGRRPLMPTTVNIVLRYLAVAINWAVKNKKIAENPLKQMPYEPVPEDNRPFLVREDLIPFLMKVDALGNTHQQVAVRAMLLMGLRESEALRLRWDGFTGDWDFYAPARAKNGKAQPVPVPAEVLRAVRALPQESEWVLPGRAGSLHLKGYTRKVVEEAGAEIGKPGLTPHRLRASCATIHAAKVRPKPQIVPPSAVVHLPVNKVPITGVISTRASQVASLATTTWVTAERVIDAFLAGGVDSPHTRRAYGRHLSDAFKQLGIEDVRCLTGENLAHYRALLMAQDQGPSTKAQALAAMRAFLRWYSSASGHQRFDGEVLRATLRAPRVQVMTPYVVLTETEAGLMINATTNPRDRAIVMVLLGAGPRVDELAHLDVGDLRHRSVATTDTAGQVSSSTRTPRSRRWSVLPRS